MSCRSRDSRPGAFFIGSVSVGVLGGVPLGEGVAEDKAGWRISSAMTTWLERGGDFPLFLFV